MINDRQTVRLTEAQLHQLVESTVEEIMLQEGWWDSFKGGAKALGNIMGGGARQAADKAGNSVRKMGQNVANKANQLGQSAANKVNQYGQAAVNKMNQFGQAAADKVNAAVDSAQQFGQNVGNTIKTGAANQNLQASKQKAIEALDNFIQVSRTAPGGLNDNTLNAVKQAKAALMRAGGVSKGQYTRSMNRTMNQFR